uniref:Transcription factor TFIIIB component B'' Myb domain-containing protein n=1 Tax=Anopheles stephensi TaxID=30069 RepID=A0A182YM90_ANOST
MATRRPRVKVAANLSIRRPPKANTANVAVEAIKQESAPSEPVKEIDVANAATLPAQSNNAVPDADGQSGTCSALKPDAPSEEPFQEFKLPKPVDDVVKPAHLSSSPSSCSEPNASLPNNVPNGEEPTSPRKQDTRPTFTLPLARKRNRTESLTSNKSLPEGVTVNKVTRKVATKQEESQRTLDNKKEIRKRLTNIENVDKQNLTMFDMIYYNPVNNPMAPPALSKRGSLENIPKSVDGGREREGGRSRSVSKSRSPTPVPSGSITVPAPKPAQAPPVQLTPQLKLGPNGEMILDEASLVIENEREREMRETLANTDIVYQDEFSGNSGYYSRNRRTKEWDSSETIRFYRCLHTVGTDFSMMLTMFPQRSRRDLKLKFKKEERLNLQLVNKALQYPNEFNVEQLKQQFADEDEQLERQRQAEKERKLEALKTQQKEQLQKKLLLQMSTNSNPQRKLSKSERALVDESEALGPEVLKRPKRRTAEVKKRSAVKPAVTLPTDLATVKEEQHQQQQQQQQQQQSEEQQLESLTETALSNSKESNQMIVPLDKTAKESLKIPKRTPAPKKRATAKLDASIVEQKEPQTRTEPVPPENENDCKAIDGDWATPNTPIEDVSSTTIQCTPVAMEHNAAELASTMTAELSTDMLEESVHQQPATVTNGNSAPHTMIPDTTFSNAAADENGIASTEMPSKSPLLDTNDAEQDSSLLVVMESQKNTSVPRKGAKSWKGHQRHRRSSQKRLTAKPNRSRTGASKAIEDPRPPLPDYTVAAIKKDVTEPAPMATSAPSVAEEPYDEPYNVAGPEAAPGGPFVLYEPPAATTYDNGHLALPIVKYQCVEDAGDNGYGVAHEEGTGYDASAVAPSSAEPAVLAKQDNTITVITLQNLDDQTHTTCVRTDDGHAMEPTMINELTPVEIKYDEYEPVDHLLLDSAVKRERPNVPVNVQIINYPSPTAVPSTAPIPYMVYEKMEYDSSSGTIIIPDQFQPGKPMASLEQSAQYASSSVQQQDYRDEASPSVVSSATEGELAGQSQEQTLPLATQDGSTSPKHEMPLNLPQQNTDVSVELGKQELCKVDALFDTGATLEELQQQQREDAANTGEQEAQEAQEEQEEEEEEEDDGGFSLGDIDINSLVLVESQDSVNPNRTFYEIYVSDPDTGQLSEKPLDVPADVIESIRSILESGEHR